MSKRKQKKYEKEIRAQRAAQEKIDAEDARKADRAKKAEAARAAEKKRRANLTPEERSKEDKRNGIIGLVVVIAIVLFLFVACGGSDDTDKERAGTSSSTTMATSATSSAKAQTVSDQELEAWAKSVIGVSADTSWVEAGTQGAPSWAYAVNQVYYGKGGNVVFEMQIDRKSEKEIAENVAKLYANSLSMYPQPWSKSVSYVIVTDGVGVDTAQKSVRSS